MLGFPAFNKKGLQAMTSNGMNISVKGDKLVIEIDISKTTIAKAELSKSGKSKLVASTGGFTSVQGAPGVRVGLNVTAEK